MNLEEKWLIVRFNRGDVDAVRMIYERTKGDLMALAVSLLRDTAASEDVVHDVFASFLKRGNFRQPGSLKGYLSTCVANAARNLLRANHRHPSDPLEESPALKAEGATPDNDVIADEEQRLLSRAVQNLPYEQREVVMLHLRGGLKFAEIAQSQEVSINTVLGRYRYGLEKIRVELEQFAGPEPGATPRKQPQERSVSAMSATTPEERP